MTDQDRKKQLKFYLEEDKKVNSGYYYCRGLQCFNPFTIETEIWKFQKSLRMCEYLFAIKSKSPFYKLKKLWYAYRFKKLSIRLGFTIPAHVFGPGLRILHRGNIIVHGESKIGSNCMINACVVIGTKAGFVSKVPTIGNNVYIATGAKIFGDIFIADGCVIGANAVVNKSFTEPNTIIAGVPAKAIGKVGKSLRH